MATDAIVQSYVLYALFLLMPLIPAVLMLKLFPNDKIAVSGPLQTWTFNATGAFAAYIITAGLGYFLVHNTEQIITRSGRYPVECVINDLKKTQALNVFADGAYAKYDTVGDTSDGKEATRNYRFVILLNHPIQKPETVWLAYWDYSSNQADSSLPKTPPPGSKVVDPGVVPASTGPSPYASTLTGGIGHPEAQRISVQIVSGDTQRFRLEPDGGRVKLVAEPE